MVEILNNISKFKLTDIWAAAKKGNVHLERSAQRDSVNLGHLTDEVIHCLLSLKPSDFYKTLPYQNPVNPKKEMYWDVYKTNCIGQDGANERLYIKVRVFGSSWVYVGSYKSE